MTTYTFGEKIELNDGRVARIRFSGTTAFQTGDWIGVELEEPTGKNDGSVKGDRYFDCAQGYGMFLRPSGVRRIVEDVSTAPTKRVSTSVASGAGVRSRPSSMHVGVNGAKKTNVAVNKRASVLAASPTPGARSSRMSGIRSPVKSPTKQLVSNGVSSTSTSRTSTPSTSAGVTTRRPGVSTTTSRPRESLATGSKPVPRTSALSTTRSSRQSMAPTHTTRATPSSRLARNATTRSREVPSRETRNEAAGPTEAEGVTSPLDSDHDEAATDREPTISDTASTQEESEGPGPLNFAPPLPPPIPPDPTTRARRGSSPPASVHSQRTVRSTAVSSRHVEELEAKVRLLERKRVEDREVKRLLEQTRSERDKYQGIIEKLQKKYQPQQQEIADLKKALAQAETQHASVEELQAEHDSIMEMATLDKEMAEETAEALKSELEALRARQEEMELELELLRDENAEFSKDMSPEERTSAGWLQLEKENERLRNALLRLRDLTQDREQELKSDLVELRAQVQEFEKVSAQLDDMKEKLTTSERNAEDLKQQLEAALGAEDMIEELTDRNMGLTERIDELRNAIEDLENIKELNDELEINHVEAEKQLQEEIDFKDALLLDRDRAAKLQQSSLDDADYTIAKFRELVVQLQDDLQDMQASKQISETEATDLGNKSRAMMDLNIRLQTSAAKTQVKTIELELRKMDADEASEHLAIVQLFLPESFHAERDSVLALLRFRRISFKANLLQTFIRERVSAFGTHDLDDSVFAGVDVLNSLTWIATMAERFVSSICTCSIEDFSKYETALYELEPVERALNGHVDALRRDEIKEETISNELLRSIGVMDHLASLHIVDSLSSHADELVARTQVVQSQLEGIASTFTALGTLITRSRSHTSAEDEETDEEYDTSDMQLLIKRAESLVTHARSVKVVVSKANRALVELQERALTLDPACDESFTTVEVVAKKISRYCRQVGDAVQSTVTEEGRLDALTASDISSAISQQATSAFELAAPEAGPFSAVASQLRSLSDLVADLAALPNDLDNTVEFERAPAPWVARAEQLKQQKLSAQDTESELARAQELLRERELIVKTKDAELEEQSVRIETLEARMRDASKRSARIVELEGAVQKAIEAEKRAKRNLEKSRHDAQLELERVREELNHVSAQKNRGGPATELQNDAMGQHALLAMKGQDQKITTLQSTVRFLKDENTRLRMPANNAPRSTNRSLVWLYEPLLKSKSNKQLKDAALSQKGRHVLSDLLHLATTSYVVDLTTLPANKLAWRPAKAGSRWQVEKKKEDWEIWRSTMDDFVKGVPAARSTRMAIEENGTEPARPSHAADPQTKIRRHMRHPLSVDIKVPGSLPLS